jgi:hypothetical protein
LDVSFIGFYRPDTSIAAIIANLQTTDPDIKRIIANVAEFSKIAIELTKLKTADMLIAGLNKDANNPSKELELRTKSYQLQQHIHSMVSAGLEWDGATVDKLVKLAVDMAVTSGKLDKTLANKAALANFIKNTTATALSGITQAIEAVSETANLMGSVLLGTTRAINGVQKSLLRTEMLGLYLGYMIYYLMKGNWAEKLGFWGMPLINPIGPIIGMEWMAKSALGVEPSMTTPFIMMFLFYLVWDRQKVDPLTNSISSLFGMCRRSAPIAPNGEQQARNVPPAEPVAPRRSRWNVGPPSAPVQPVPVRPPSRWGPRTPRSQAEARAYLLELEHQNALRREAEQQRGLGRRTRKNKKQNRRRTRK